MSRKVASRVKQDITDRELSVQTSSLGPTAHSSGSQSIVGSLVDARPSKATLETQSSQHSTTSRKFRRSEDERQLLGYNANEIDPDAVFISIPTSRPKIEPMPVVNGGPRPMNTLAGQHNQQQSTITAMKNGAGRAIGVFGNLITSAISGNNVETFKPREPLSDVTVEVRAPKRQKTTHSTQPQKFSPVEEIDDDDDGDDILSRGPRGVEILPRMNGRSNSSMSLTTSSTSKPGPPWQASDKYLKLEERMNSTRYVQYARSHNPPPKVAAKLQPRGHVTPSIDLTGSDSVSKQPYKGTARPSGQSGNPRDQSIKQRLDESTLSDTQSRFFPISSHSRNKSRSLSPFKASAQPCDVDASLQTHNLNDTFVSIDGKRRNSYSGTSSDELAATSPIGDYASVSRLSPRKQSRRVSPTPQVQENQQGISLPARSADVESSNIKPTIFTDSVVKPKRAAKPHLKRQSTKKKYGFECRAVVIDNFFLEGGQHGLGLVFDDNNREILNVHFNGQVLSETNTSRYVPLNKIGRVVWSSDSSIVQLVFSRGEGYPFKVAVKFASEATATDFLLSIQQLPINFHLRDQDGPHMEKLFVNSIKEAQNYTNMKQNTSRSIDSELELLERRKQQRDEKGYSASDHEQADLKRRRKDQRITDRLEGNKSLVKKKLALDDLLPKSKRQASHRVLNYSDTDLSVSQPHTKIDRILDDALNTSESPYVTRSRASAGRVFQPSQGISQLAEEFPEDLRYSKTHGLGTRWKKPLIFPMTGKKKTTVEYDDLERLDDGQFLNDNLLGFYLRYLEYHLEEQRPDVAKKVYWFNTYFFASLTQTIRGKRGINYEAVRKWTRNIDVFTFDYAVVPINESAHWYVAIICNLRAINRNSNIERGDGSSSPQLEKFEALDDFEAELPEDISAVLEVEETKETKQVTTGARKTEDEDATESFADLQLSEKEDKSIPEKDKAANSEGRSLPKGLFKRVLALEPMPPLLQQHEQETLEVEPNGAVVTDELTGRTPVSQKKGKRKSIPPQRVFDPEQPAIITLDSLGMSHSPTIRVLKDYLREEANDKRGGMVFDDTQIKGITVKQIPLQDNFCDCGPFLLGYMEKFVENPRDFVTKVLQRDLDLLKDWPKLNPTVMRVTVRELVQELHSEQEDEQAGTKRKPVAKVRNEEAKIEQESSVGRASKQLPLVADGADDDKLPSIDAELMADERGDPPVSSRRTALETALPINEVDPLLHSVVTKRKQVDNGPGKSPKSLTALSVITTNAPIVLDSEESVAHAHPPDVLAAESTQYESMELPTEIPESPTCPTTHGKPSPDPEFQQTTTSSKRKFERTDGARLPRDHRQVISVSDS